ncbi:MAG: Gfo/Idh/MocA family oxidoreductase [Candidatus Pelagibacter bacterium]|jgi:predicted dehydrogenase|nr:Gfo/Idh/MocA family oxidoreductase [Candidatus Pelagibacter bacterium]|tara:strand:- start:322 stop:1329 length:1008 start_codon:yes stop_codon:yes gene_type:complete
MGRQVNFKIGIIGCGLIGKKRSQSLGLKGKLIACADPDIDRAKKIASSKEIKVFKDWKKLLEVKEIDIVIIATPHNQLFKIIIQAYKMKKHILVEKPGSKNLKEMIKIISKVKNNKIKIKVGFNHRYHPSIIKAKKIIKSGIIGKPMYLRARYGHGGRPRYEKEWRAKPSISGGGELIDQGSHLIDLSRLFLGEFSEVTGFINTYFWKMSVEDNAFLTLKTNSNKIAFLHVSWTEWKNMFSFEIFCSHGKLDINGMGGSYGQEQLTLYKMSKKMGIPKQRKWRFKLKDISWKTEINDFYDDIIYNRKPKVNLNDAYQNLKIINKIYKNSKYDYIT